MILRVDHMAIAVKDYDKARDFFVRILGAVPGSAADDNSHMMYRWENIALGDLSRLELLTPTGSGSFLDGFRASRDGGVHHITLQTSDIEETRKVLEKEDIPFFGYNAYGDAWKELFIHPRDAFGVLIQIAEFRADDWLSSEVQLSGGQSFELDNKGSRITLRLSHEGGGFVTSHLSQEEARRLRDELDAML